jgi:V-type H+-transporting ATPase subunit F
MNGQSNFLIVNSETSKNQIETAFKDFTSRGNIAVLIIAQVVANEIRKLINDYQQIIPAIIEIPSKDSPYEPKNDTVLKKASKIIGKSDE